MNSIEIMPFFNLRFKVNFSLINYKKPSPLSLKSSFSGTLFHFSPGRDLNELDDYEDDDRTLDKLINGVNVTTEDENMWLIPYAEDGTQVCTIFPLPHTSLPLTLRL